MNRARGLMNCQGKVGLQVKTQRFTLLPLKWPLTILWYDKVFPRKWCSMTLRHVGGWSALCALVALSFWGCRRAEDVWPGTGKKRVLASFPPLYCFAKNVAGDDADVRCLLKAQGPHDFTPHANDVLLARNA